ncbi:non-ribosomal peptide synthetase [Variovorax sp. J22R115]|uniref:non-ribosomal peptide synthetase n=1 Tax=Variovorax sp. J22R115 TaxID=3053509 RepID=UPI002578829D|nr:non-ribosomal peptide synthetase [Variovorax sp. J22R115]MDM0053054.1 amino acid adenylation domain-containing protein [Variovorax sp. J22R115]
MLNGGRLVGVGQDTVLSPPKFAAFLREQRITTLFLTPALFNQIAREMPEAFATLRQLLLGGDQLDAQWVREVLRAGAPERLLNAYGPTENTTFSSWKLVREVAADAATVPIGRAVANTQLHVLDAHGQQLPIGVPGELHLGGDGLALGYLGRPEASAERFIANPLDGGHTRLYRTGDIVRRRADGDIEFIGRRDHQVKIRGFRVELGEIETALVRQPAVREAVVLARQDRPGQRELVAYVVARGPARPVPGELRQALAQRLAQHMLPSRYVVLDALPLNENGKVDRHALPAPADEPEGEEGATGFAAPQGEREACIAQVWQQVLGRARIGREDNYFDLGGDSITAIQVVSRLRRSGWRVPVADLFRHPTVAALALRLQEDAPEATQAAEAGAGEGEIALTAVQRWFFEHHEGHLDHFNQAVLLALDKTLDASCLRQALDSLVRRHDALRLRFEERVGALPRQTCVAPEAGDAPLLETIDLRGDEASPASIEARADEVQRGLDIARGPLMRAALLRRDSGDRLLLVIHHLAVDAVSWRILLEDLEIALRQIAAGRPIELETPTCSFARWAQRIGEFTTDPALLAEDAYWSRIEDSETARLPTTADARAALRHGDARSLASTLSRDDTARLLTRSHRLFETGIMELLLVALGRALKRWSGSQTTRITLEGHGREPPDDAADPTRTVGWFTSIYPFLLDVAGDDIGSQMVQMKAALRAVPRKGMGYGLLRHGSRPRRLDPSRQAQLSFNYLGQFGGDDDHGDAPLLRLDGGPTGRAIDPALRRAHEIDVTGLVFGGRLALSLDFDPATLAEPAAAALLDGFAAQLVEVARHCHERLERIDAVRAAPARVEDAYALSPLQEGMLFQALLEPDAAIYQVQVRFRFIGALDGEAFRGAWYDLCQRHAVLRSAFVHDDLARPMQLVLKDRGPEFRVGALSDLDTYCADDRRRGFDLQRDALLRVALFRERDDLHHVVWSYHHILLDGWCLAILQRDFLELYAARLAGRAARLPATAPYRDYIRWLEAQDRDAARRHWREALAGYEQAAALPRRAARDAGSPRALADRMLVLDAATSARLVRLAATAGVTLNAVVQTLWGLLLARYADRDEVVFGTIVSGRPAELAGVEQMVGLFIGAVPVRVTLPPDAPIAVVARRVQERALANEPHQHLSLAEIQAQSALGRGLFDHLLIFENYPLSADAAPSADTGLAPRLEAVEAHDPTHYDLDLAIVPGECIAFRFTFDSNVYRTDQIERTAGHLRTAIDSVLDDPARPLRDIEILPPGERELVLQRFNATDVAYPRERLFVDLVEAQAARAPEAVALRCNGFEASYRELERAANRLAHHLRRCGVGPEVKVGVCLERSPQMIVAPLAVWKAGGTFVPLDPDYPPQRLAFMVADAVIRVLVTQGGLAGGLDGEGGDMRWVRLDADAAAIDAEPDTPPARRPDAGQTAYVIYTSGSTGQPKGVAVAHASLANVAFAWRDAYGLGDFPPRLLQVASLSFDVFVGDLVRALAHGGTLVVCPSDALLDPASVYALLVQHDITILEATPALVLPLMEHVHRQDLPLGALRLLIVGSDLLPAHHFRTLWQRFGNRLRILNSYGATEATIDSTFFEMADPAVLAAAGANTPIGRPLANMRCFVLDRLGRPQPLGAPGELHLGGAGVARGYLNRAELTAARFVACAAAGGERVYRTGDLARWLPDGNLDFLGRTDTQVKVRGYRIELGEIEDRLLHCPCVDQAVVVASDAGQGSEIVAYVVAGEGWEVGVAREFLRRTLPGYMIPAFFVRLDRLPLSPNGKVDRKALPDARTSAERMTAFTPPQGATEVAIAAIWHQVLRAERIGRHDDFFAIGGHSLKAMQITAQIHKTFGVSVPLRRLFDDPTIEALARLVQGGDGAERLAFSAIPLAPALAHYELSHAQRRLWMLHQMDGGAAYNMPEAHVIDADVDAKVLRRALAALMARHEALRTAFVTIDGEPRQQIRGTVPFAIAEFDLRADPQPVAETRAREIADRDANLPFDLTAPPLLRASLARLPHGRCLFVLTLHHIVGDGWSGNLVLRELLALYEAFRHDRPDPLQPLRIQYKDFAHWQNARGFAPQERYWLTQLAGVPERIALPYDFALEALRDFSGDRVRLRLDPGVAAGLRRLARGRRTTLANLMLALFELLLFHWTRQNDLCIGMSVANRSHPDVEGLVGFFVNLLPIRCRLDDDMDFDELLDLVVERSGEALEQQDYPFDMMIEKLNPERRANRQPLVNVVYGFQNFVDVHTDSTPDVDVDVESEATRATAAVRWEPFDFSFRTSKFDLTLFVVEESDALDLTIEYDSTLFLAATIRAQLDRLAGFAAQVVGVDKER